MKKKDLATYLGLILGSLAILIGMALDSGKIKLAGLKLFWDLPSVFITIGGSFFTLILAFPLNDVKNLGRTFKNAFIENQLPGKDIIIKFVDLSKES